MPANQMQTTTVTTTAISERLPLRIIKATEEEMTAHQERLDSISKSAGGKVMWLEKNNTE